VLVVFIYSVRINYWRILLCHKLSRKCSNIVKFVTITHIERSIWNGSIVATAISWEKHKPVLEGFSVCVSMKICYHN
jgi:hypothetical protein